MAEATKVSVRDGLFQTQVWSAGSGPPLLFLHGWAGMLGWPSWLDGLTDRFRVVAPQHPGYGQSTGGDVIEDVIDMALYYFDFMDAMGMDRPAILGHSLGANFAAEMAALSPPSVGKLVLMAPTGLWDDKHPVTDMFAMLEAERQQLNWHDPAAAESKGLFVNPKTDDEMRAAGLEVVRALATATRFLFPIPDKGLKRRIHRIKAPTLLLWGASDKIVPPAYGKIFQQRIKGSKVVEIPKAGHQAIVEQPEQSLAAIKQFLES